MKLLFSEYKSDYGHYTYSYAIWGIPDPGETPALFFRNGFMPASPNLERFYLCRHVRVDLQQFRPSSENRRILRKGAGLTATLVPRPEFDYTPARRKFYTQYADARWGKGIMSEQRLDALLQGKVISHVLLFHNPPASEEVGAAILYLEEPEMAFYYYAFYDLTQFSQNLGMFMMTRAVEFFAEKGFRYLYLGTCYSQKALYKAQFAGLEFFNGFRWSSNLDELKYLLRREQQEVQHHLLATPEFGDTFYGGDLKNIAAATPFQVRLPSNLPEPGSG
jgi:arginyl-tRNA--protein-N-Asp/Glu arginylyltransferase